MPTLQPGSTSQAFDVDIGQTVSVTPGSGGTMLVEYTTNSETDIRNGSATWQAWTAGTVSSSTSDVAMFPLFARVTAYTAAGSYELSGSGLRAVPNQYLAWKSDVVSARDPVSAAAVVGAALGPVVILGTSAAYNTTLLQAAVDRAGPGGKVTISPNLGVVEINSTIYHDNIIEVMAGTTLRLADGSTCSMFRNREWNPTRTTATGMTSSGRVGTISLSSVPSWVTVGKSISVLGATNTGYNGVHVVTGIGAGTITVRLPRTPAAGSATGTVTVAPVDECIGLIGKGCVDYNEANQAADGTMNTIATVWCNVGRCFVGEGLQFLNAKKFCFLIAAYREADVENLSAETASDIIHFLGPGTETVCERVSGSSGDDSLAFTVGDVAWFNLSRGDFFSIRVNALNCDSLQALVRISGNSGHKFYDVDLQNCFGSSVASPITIADFNAELQGLDFDHIRIDGVNCETATTVPIVAVSTLIAGGGDRLDVNVTQLPSNGEALAVNAATTTVRSARVKVANPVDGCTKGALLVGASATLNSATVEGLRVSYGSNVFAAWIVGSLNELRVLDCEVAGSGSRVVAQQGTSGRIMMDNIRHTSGFRTFEQSAAANANVEVLMSNIRSNSITNLAHFEKAATLVTSNVIVPSGGASGSVVSVNSAVTVTWRGDASYTGNTESTLTGGATLTKSSSVIA